MACADAPAAKQQWYHALNWWCVANERVHAVQEQYAGMGAEPVGSSPSEFALYNETELAKWEKIVRASGAKAN